MDELHMICVVDEAKMVDRVTYDEIVDFIAWNMSVLESGVYPDRDHLNQEFTDPLRKSMAATPLTGDDPNLSYRGCFTTWLGDLKERVMAHRFERNYRSDFDLSCVNVLGCGTRSYTNLGG